MSDDRSSTRAPLSKQLFLSLYLPSILMSLGQSMVAPVIPVFAKTFEVGLAEASLVFVVGQAGSVAATFPAGYLIDKIGRRPVLFAGPVLTAFGSGMTPFAGSFMELLIYRFIVGAATLMWQEARLAVIADTAAPRQRARQSHWMMGMSRAGHLLGPAAGGFMAAAFGLWVPFEVHAALVLIAIIPSFALIQETAPGRRRLPGGEKEAVPDPGWRGVIAYMLTFQMIVFLCIQMSANLARGGHEYGSLNLYAVYAYDVGPEVLGLMNTLAVVAGLPVPFLTGWLMDKFSRRFVIVPGFSLYASSVVFMSLTAFFPNTPFIYFMAAYVLVQFSQGTIGGTMQVLGTDLAPAFARGRFFAIWRGLAQIAGTASPAIFALVAEKVHYGAGFLTLAFFGYLVAFGVGVVLKDTLKEAERAAAERAATPERPS